MKILIAAIVTAFVLSPSAPAQDGPASPGSATVARPRPRPGANAPTNGAPAAPDSSLPQIPSKLSPKATKDTDPSTDVTFKADANVVNIDVAVIDPDGRPIPNIPRANFRILEDKVPQTLTQFSVGEAPMTVALVIEFSARYQSYYSMGWGETLTAAYGFVQTLKPDDYLAIIAYDLKSEILSDFTNDRRKTQEALSMLRIPGFSESNMFDALTDTADRMSKIEGRKAILLIASGIDTFSKLTYDKTRRRLQDSGVPVYSLSILQVARMMAESSGTLGAIENLDFLQADNELRTFAKETGGQAYFPRFQAEMPGVFHAVAQSLRNQYSLGFSSNNQAKDGKFRKLTIQLVNPENNQPLKVMQNGKSIKYTVIAKAGYTAPRAVE